MAVVFFIARYLARTPFGRFVVGAVALAIIGLPSPAAAAPLGVTCPGGLQPLPQATFGGAGIPNFAVCQITLNVGQDVIMLGLTATARFANTAVTNDGVGTFSAEYGGDTLNAAPTFARWNWDWYIDVAGTGTYAFELLYDFDPGANTDAAQLGRVNPTPGPGPGTAQDSWNNGMAFLGVTAGAVTRPTIPGAFDPNAIGQFSFGIIARQIGGAEIGRVSMNVETVPEPATMALIGSGLLLGRPAHPPAAVTLTLPSGTGTDLPPGLSHKGAQQIMKRVLLSAGVGAALLAFSAQGAAAAPITGVYTTGGDTTGTGPWTLTATPSTFSFLSFVFDFPVVFDSLNDLSVDFESLAGGGGGGLPRLRLLFDYDGNGVISAGDKSATVHMGTSPNFVDTIATLNTWSGYNYIGNNDTGRWDLSAFGAGQFTNYAAALALLGTTSVLRASVVVNTFAPFPDFALEIDGINAAAIPEPATLGLIGLGLAGAARRFRRKA